MCWSAKSSKESYTLCMISSALLFMLGNSVEKVIAIFYFIVGHMQVIEYFIWTSENCDKQNSTTSKFIFPVLALQPLVLVACTYFYKISYLPNKVLKSYVMIYLLCTIGVLLKYFYENKNKHLCTKKVKDIGLVWDTGSFKIDDSINFSYNSIITTIYFAHMFFFALLWKNSYQKYLHIIICVSSYLHIKMLNEEHWESRWCFPTFRGPLFFLFMLFLRMIYQNNK